MDNAVAVIDLRTLERLAAEVVEYAHDVIPGEDEAGDQFVSDVKGFAAWVRAMRMDGVEGRVTKG